jgi:hypothetical protein
VQDYVPYVEVDAETLVEASRRYTGLRRRYWRSALGVALMMAVMTLAGALLRQAPHPYDKLIFLLLLCYIACFIRCVFLWFSLLRFPCPRCGKRFILDTGSSWPGPECKHCLLRLG